MKEIFVNLIFVNQTSFYLEQNYWFSFRQFSLYMYAIAT